MVKGLVAAAMFLMVLGGVFAGAGWLVMDETRPFDDGIETTAQIIGVSPGTTIIDGRVHQNDSPIYRFEAVDGETYFVTDHVASSDRVAVGSTVDITYRADDPGNVRRTDIDYSWLWSFVIGGGFVAGLGILTLVAAVWVGVTSRARRARGDAFGPAAPFAPHYVR